jgi:hypothetical protein
LIKKHTCTIRLADIQGIYIERGFRDIENCFHTSVPALHIIKGNPPPSLGKTIIIDAPIDGDAFVKRVQDQIARVKSGEVLDTPPQEVLQAAQQILGFFQQQQQMPMVGGQQPPMGMGQPQQMGQAGQQQLGGQYGGQYAQQQGQQGQQGMPPMYSATANTMDDRDAAVPTAIAVPAKQVE